MEATVSTEQAGLGRFDAALEEIQGEEASDRFARAAAEVQRVEAEKAELKANSDEELSERHDLQVSMLVSISTLLYLFFSTGADQAYRPSNAKYETISKQGRLRSTKQTKRSLMRCKGFPMSMAAVIPGNRKTCVRPRSLRA